MRFYFWISLLVTLNTICYANTDQQLLDCRQLLNPELRLACYDHIANGLTHHTAKMPEEQPKPVPSPNIPDTTSSSATSKILNTPIPLATEKTKDLDESSPQDFGKEHLKKKKTTQKQLIISRLLNENFNGWSGKTKFYLENGQIWQQADKRKFYLKLNKPLVQIEKGLFGAYYLSIEGYNSRAKVKRIQ